MADDYTIGGDTFGSDDITSVHYPRVKLITGEDGVNDGDVADVNPMPVGGNTVKDGSGSRYPLLQDSEGRLIVVGAGTLASQVDDIVPGYGTTNLGKRIDDAAGGTDTGVAILAQRDDALAALTVAEADWDSLRLDANGALWVSIASGGGSTQYTEDGASAGGESLMLAGAVATPIADRKAAFRAMEDSVREAENMPKPC